MGLHTTMNYNSVRKNEAPAHAWPGRNDDGGLMTAEDGTWWWQGEDGDPMEGNTPCDLELVFPGPGDGDVDRAIDALFNREETDCENYTLP